MKHLLLAVAGLLYLSLAIPAQKLDRPTLTPKPCSESEKNQTIAGTKLHDTHKYAEAIAAYEEVLKSNPECMDAMYELSMTYYASGEKLKAAEVANKGTKYISDTLPLFYLTLANVLDDAGKPDDAVRIYTDGIKILKEDPKMRAHLSSLYYNLGVTYAGQKKYTEARQQLKESIQANFAYASPHYLLSQIYYKSEYNVPAFLAAMRLVSLEFNSQRTVREVGLIYDLLMPKKNANGSITVNLNFMNPKDEGDFTMYEVILPTLTTMGGDKDKGKSPNDLFIDGIGSFTDILQDDKKLRKTFVGDNYVPFMVELKKRGYLPVLGNVILFIHDTGNKSAGEWLDTNGAKTQEFFDWAKNYVPPAG